MTKNRLPFAGSQNLLASKNEFNSTGNFNSTETVGDARRLSCWRKLPPTQLLDLSLTKEMLK